MSLKNPILVIEMCICPSEMQHTIHQCARQKNWTVATLKSIKDVRNALFQSDIVKEVQSLGGLD